MRRLGIEPSTAAAQLQRAQSGGESFQTLPPRPTGSLVATAADLNLPVATPSAFHVYGDTGGVKDPHPQLAVAKAMAADLQVHPEVGFAWHVGDIDYFEGAPAEYGPQFFEAYADYNRHILGHPGNHDGEGGDELKAFMATFCDPSPKLIPAFAEFNRDTVNQPYCYWTMQDTAITIIALYTNVPSGGEVDATQEAWLVEQLKAAPKDRPLAVSLHHPAYSVDTHHGGSARMGELLDRSFKAADRCPALVLSGHVHDTQVFRRTLAEGQQCVYVVCGNGGYHNTHALTPGAVAGAELAPGVIYEYGDDTGWGFMRLTVEGDQIAGSYTKVARDGTVVVDAYQFAA